MNQKRRKLIGFGLGFLFIFFLVCFGFKITSWFKGAPYTSAELFQQIKGEEFDPQYIRLNTIKKVIDYCDSLSDSKATNLTYPEIVSHVLRQKFYHGYSYYSKTTNPLAVLLAPVVKKGAAAIVIPDDIVKFPNAACSQQSIVGMEIFEKKGYQVRKISMYDTVSSTGHFAYEVYYDNSWHFFDTNQEPDSDVLRKYNRPSVAFLTNHPEIVAAAYHNQKHPDVFQRLVLSHTVGPVNIFPAPNAYIFQTGTKLFSNFGWLVFGLAFLGWNWKRKKKLAPVPITGEIKLSNPELDLSRNYKSAKVV